MVVLFLHESTYPHYKMRRLLRIPVARGYQELQGPGQTMEDQASQPLLQPGRRGCCRSYLKLNGWLPGRLGGASLDLGLLFPNQRGWLSGALRRAGWGRPVITLECLEVAAGPGALHSLESPEDGCKYE